jgi:hypothetical protein
MTSGAATAPPQRTQDRVALVADDETLESWDEDLVSSNPLGFQDSEPYCERVVCAEHASLAVIVPEGASAILYRTTARAPELAASQGSASWELKRFGIADVVVPERTSADREPRAFVARLGAVVEHELRLLLAQGPEARLASHQRRYQYIGNPKEWEHEVRG